MRTFLIAALLFCGISCAHKAIMNDINLTWSPTTKSKDFEKYNPSQYSGTKISVEKFKDNRDTKNKELLGENVEDEQQSKPFTSKSDLGEYYQMGLKKTMREIGFDVTDSNPTYVLGGELNDLFIREKNTYEGRISMRLHLKKAGQVVWEGTVNAENKKFGRSYKLDNYMEMYSDLGLEVLTRLLEIPKFVTALGGKTPAPATANTTATSAGTTEIIMTWKPTSSLKDFEKTFYKDFVKNQISVENFVDARNPISEVIGEYEKKSLVKQVTTKSDIGAFYTNSFANVLTRLGFENSKSADFKLGGKITHLFIKEQNTYVASLIVKFQLKKGNKTLLEEVVSVENKRFGRTYRMDNYQELYSDLAIEALLKLFSDNGLKKAMSSK